MSADALLSRLSGVKKTGRESWVARCPSHEDRRPSLSIRALEDGRLLVHDFGGCDVQAVLAAVSLDFDALYPPRLSERNHREPRPFNPRDVLACLSFEALVVATAAGNLRQGVALTDEDHERLLLAASRLQQAEGLAYGR